MMPLDSAPLPSFPSMLCTSTSNFLSDVTNCQPYPDPSATSQPNVVFQCPSYSTMMPVKEEWPIISLQDTSPGASCLPPCTTSAPSPMAISPNRSTLNTPRGSITSIRSGHGHSPMNTDTQAPQHPVVSSEMKDTQCSFLPDSLFPFPDPPPAPFENYVPTTCTSSSTTHFGSYTLLTSYPSPPRSAFGSPVPPATTGPYSTPLPPSYEEHMSVNSSCYPPTSEDLNLTLPPLFEPAPLVIKSESDYSSTASPIYLQGGGTVSFSSPLAGGVDSCPETPDSSVRDSENQTPDTGNYVCLWVDCNLEFDSQKTLVDHVNESHVESSKKGCEERPCLWKVN